LKGRENNMSCEQNTKAYEGAHDKFWIEMEEYSFQHFIGMELLTSMEVWKEKEFGFNEDPYDRVFQNMWDWDCELLCSDLNECLHKYIDQHGKFSRKVK
jgi:hypothetical protein